MKKEKNTETISGAGKIFGIWLTVLCFLLPVKFASLAVMPEATSFFPEDLFSWLIVTYPAHVWGIVSGATLLAALFFFPLRKGELKTLSGKLLLLWGIVPAAAVLIGWRNGAYLSYSIGMLAHFAGISAFVAAAGLYLLKYPAQRRWLLGGIVCSALYLGFSGLYQYFVGFAEMREFIDSQIAAGEQVNYVLWAKVQDNRVYANFTSANVLAGFLLLTLPLLLTALYQCGDYFEPQKVSRILFPVIGFGLSGTVFLMTKSRGGFLCALVIFGIWVLTLPMRRRWRLSLAAAAVATVLAGGIYIQMYGRGFLSASERVDYIRTSVRMVCEKPLAGYGWGGFFERHMALKTTNSNESARDPHNVLASFASQAGIFGGILIAAVLFVPLFYQGRRVLRREASLTQRAVFWGSCAFLLHCMLDVNMQIPACFAVFGVMQLLALAEEKPQSEPGKTACLPLLMLGAAALVSVSFNIHWVVGEKALDDLMIAARPGENMGSPAEIQQKFKRVLKFRSYSTMPYEVMGDHALAMKDFDTAAHYYRKSLAINEARPAIHRRLHELALQKGDNAAAEKELKRMRELFPSNPEYNDLNKRPVIPVKTVK